MQRSHVLHVEVTHGADRYDIHLHKEQPPTVRDLMSEVERKARVTMSNQQLMFRGQRLHQSMDEPLASFGMFNGNQITLIGRKLNRQQDEQFNRLLTTERDIHTIDNIFGLVARDLENMKRSRQARNQLEPYLYDLYMRIDRCRTELQTYETSLNQINMQGFEIDGQRKREEIFQLIQDRSQIANNILQAIDLYQGEN